MLLCCDFYSSATACTLETVLACRLLPSTKHPNISTVLLNHLNLKHINHIHNFLSNSFNNEAVNDLKLDNNSNRVLR